MHGAWLNEIGNLRLAQVPVPIDGLRAVGGLRRVTGAQPGGDEARSSLIARLKVPAARLQIIVELKKIVRKG